MNDDTPSDGNWTENLANLGKAIGPFLPKFRNLRKVRDRLLGDVAEAAFDALVSRMRLYQTRNQAEAIRTVVERSGLPPSVAHEMVSRQEAIDTLVAIETYGFDRSTIRTGYRPTARGRRSASVDVVIFRHGQEPSDDSVERVIVCQTQKPREKLRSPQEAAADLRKLKDKPELLPSCHMGMWTNGHEEFFGTSP